MDAELEGVPATDELRRQIAEVIADYHGRMIQAHTLFRSYELAGELLPLVVAVVAEARTEGAIAALEDFDRRKSFGIENWRVHRDITNIVAALRGVGNQKVGVTVDDLALDEMDGNQNAEPRWSANWLEEVLREGLPDQNAEPLSTADPLHRATLGDSLHNAWRAGYRLGWDDRGSNRGWRKYEANPYPEADQKGTEQ